MNPNLIDKYKLSPEVDPEIYDFIGLEYGLDPLYYNEEFRLWFLTKDPETREEYIGCVGVFYLLLDEIRVLSIVDIRVLIYQRYEDFFDVLYNRVSHADLII